MLLLNKKELGDVLDYSWKYGGIAVQGRYFRENANWVAAAASLGFLSTRTNNNTTFGNTWRITSKGLRFLNEVKDIG